MKMSQYVASQAAKRAGSISGSGVPKNNIPIYRYAAEQMAINKQLNGYNVVNKLRNIVLPTDGKSVHSRQQAQIARQTKYRTNASAERFSHFMVTPNQNQRLNNPSQISAMQQPQRVGPDSKAQFYAFISAMSTNFGSLRGGA
jgi:hypothetical protein